jgi:hypothetical protein
MTPELLSRIAAGRENTSDAAPLITDTTTTTPEPTDTLLLQDMQP